MNAISVTIVFIRVQSGYRLLFRMVKIDFVHSDIEVFILNY